MNRYKKANEGIHAPEHVKERAAGPQGRRRGYPRWEGAVAAMLSAPASVRNWAAERDRNPSITPV